MNIINLGVLAHVDAGKTTITEGLLYHSGVTSAMGNVDKGTTITDSMELEQKRGMTIRASTVSFTWKGTKINLIDTPGHMDFVGEVERSLSVLDGVVLVISAKEGVQPQTRVIFRKLKELHIPTILFINKVDRMGVELEELYEDIQKQLTGNIVIMQKIIGAGTDDFDIKEYNFTEECLQLQILNGSERLLEKYVNNCVLNDKELKDALIISTRNSNLYPVFQGAALVDKGIDILLSAIIEYFDGSISTCMKQLSAYIYKIDRDVSGHKKLYFRMFGGTLRLRDRVTIYDTKEKLIIKSLAAVVDGKVIPAYEIGSGDIGILYDVFELKCGYTIGHPFLNLKTIGIAKPLLSAGIIPVQEEQRRKVLDALKELSEEDSLLKLQIDSYTEEITLQLFGKLQMEVIKYILKEQYGLSIEFAELKTIYKEQPIQKGIAAIRIYESDNFYHAGVVLSVEPLEPGAGFQYDSKVSYGYLEKSFQNAVLEGIQKGMCDGISGHEVIDIKVTFLDADYDSVNGTPSDFRKLTPLVFRKALESITVRLLEPWQSYELQIPIDYEKKVISDLRKMRASIEEILYQGSQITICGRIPTDTSKNYAAEIITFTEGKGIMIQKFHSYEACRMDEQNKMK